VKSSLYGAAAEYAMHSLLTLSAREHPVSVGDLAAYQQIPERYLAKLFTRLQKAKLVSAIEGVAGGFVLAKPAAKIRVLDILEAVDPDRRLFACAEIRGNCALFTGSPPAWSAKGPCQIHAFMLGAEWELKKFLATKTLADLGQELSDKAPRGFAEDTTIWFHQRKTKRGLRRKGSEQLEK
jgi:Rrf2 family protein